MITIEENAVIGEDGKLVMTLPPSVPPGIHRVIVMVGEASTPQVGDDPVLELIGAYSSGRSDTAQNAEEILYGRPDVE